MEAVFWAIWDLAGLFHLLHICGRGQTGNITPAFHVSHSLPGCMSLQVKVAIDGQGEYEVEEGKHFYFTVADHLRAK